jgi:hypothetical protein
MSHRPFPNVDRALRNLRHQQAVYKYGRVPQRYVLGFDADLSARIGKLKWRMDLAAARRALPFEVDEYRLSTR